MELKEARCINCNKLLAMLSGKAEIKCTRCGTINRYDEQGNHNGVVYRRIK